MKKMTISLDQIALNTRHSWGTLNPCSRRFRSKKDYNRKDKSWKTDF